MEDGGFRYQRARVANTSQGITVLAFSSEDGTTQSQMLQNAPLQPSMYTMTFVDERMPKKRRMCFSRPAPDLPSLFQMVYMPEEVTVRRCFHNALNVLPSPFISPPLNNSPTKHWYTNLQLFVLSPIPNRISHIRRVVL